MLSGKDIEYSDAADTAGHTPKSPVGLNCSDGNEWIKVQVKTFTKWVNAQLAKCDYPPVTDLVSGLSTGVSLIRLLEVIHGGRICKYNPSPMLKIQKVENINKALAYISSRNVTLTNIGAEDIADGSLKLALGLIWTVISKLAASEITDQGMEAKEALLMWCQNRTKAYKSDFVIKDFSKSWKSGLGFCALINAHCPELLDYNKLDANNCRDNTELAFSVAEENLGITRLLEVSDVVDVEKPDEKSIMTYLLQYFIEFNPKPFLDPENPQQSPQPPPPTANNDHLIKSSDVLRQTLRNIKHCEDIKNNYENRFTTLKQLIESNFVAWEYYTNLDYPLAKSFLSELKTYCSRDKFSLNNKRRHLASLLDNIQTTLSVFGFKPYTPPPGFLPSDMDALWDSLCTKETSCFDLCNNVISLHRADLRSAYFSALASLTNPLDAISIDLFNLSSEQSDPQSSSSSSALSEKLSLAESLLDSVNALYPLINNIDAAEKNCVAESAFDPESSSVVPISQLKSSLDSLSDAISTKINLINSLISRVQPSTPSPARIAELDKIFKLADADNDGKISVEELPVDFVNNYNFVSNDQVISHDEFIDFITKEDSIPSKNDVLDAISVLSNNDTPVNESILLSAGTPQSTVNQISAGVELDASGNYNLGPILDCFKP